MLGDYVFTEVSDGVIKTSKVGYAVEGLYHAMQLDQLTVIIQFKKQTKQTTSDMISFAHGQICVFPTPSGSGLEVNFKEKSLKESPLLFHRI